MAPDGDQGASADLGPPTGDRRVIEETVCPSCEAVLRNVHAGAEGKIRCLNCGKAFAHPDRRGLSAETRDPIATSTSAEPGAVSYLLLRGLGLVALFGLGATFLAVCWEVARHSSSWDDPEEFLGLVFVAALPWVGWLFFYVPASMARWDVDHVHLLWRLKILTGPLPRPPGSALPYLLPSSVVGGVGACIIVGWSSETGEHSGELFIAAALGLFLGGGGLLLGFAFDNLRLFLWRQRALARHLSPMENAGSDDEARPPISLTALLALGAPLCFGLLMLAIWCDQWRWRVRYRPDVTADDVAMLVWCAALLVVPWALFLLARAFDRGVADWQRAARSRGLSLSRVDPLARLCVIFPHLWCGLGGFLLFLLLLEEGLPNRILEFCVVVFLSLSFLCLMQGLGVFLDRLHQWRIAHDAIWETEARGRREHSSELSGWSLAAVVFPGVLTGLALLIGGWWVFDEMRLGSRPLQSFTQLVAMSLALLGISYPLAWGGLVARECMLASRALGRARAWWEKEGSRRDRPMSS
jgi:hypothetical protein